jgi:hypothetical protein
VCPTPRKIIICIIFYGIKDQIIKEQKKRRFLLNCVYIRLLDMLLWSYAGFPGLTLQSPVVGSISATLSLPVGGHVGFASHLWVVGLKALPCGQVGFASHLLVDGLKVVPCGQIGAASHLLVCVFKCVPAGQFGGPSTQNPPPPGLNTYGKWHACSFGGVSALTDPIICGTLIMAPANDAIIANVRSDVVVFVVLIFAL